MPTMPLPSLCISLTELFELDKTERASQHVTVIEGEER